MKIYLQILRNSILIFTILLLCTINYNLTNLILLAISIYSIIKESKSNRGLLLLYTISFLNSYYLKTSNMTQVIKWVGFMGICFSIIYRNWKIFVAEHKDIIIITSIWFIYNLIVSYIHSDFFVISLLKLTSFSLGVISLKMNNKHEKDDYIWIISYIIVVCFTSLLLINKYPGYYRNRIGFQGIFNQPNAMGIILPVLYSVYIYIRHANIGISGFIDIIIPIIIIMVFKSQSRTGIFTILILLIFAAIIMFFNSFKNKEQFFKYSMTLQIILIIIIVFSITNYRFIKDTFYKVVYKYDNEVLYSSKTVISNNVEIIKSNLIFGNGFGIDKSGRHISKSRGILSHSVEKRNMFLGIMTEGGIIGLILFIIFFYIYLKDIVSSIFDYGILIILAVLLINQGEFVLFAMNGSGLFVWLMLNIPKPKDVESY